jgi:hypothetical protein
MATRFRVNRRVTGSPGAPASLLSGEIAYNMVDGFLYIGYGDDGGGNATSVKAFAEDDYTGGGSTYTASGNGIELTGSEFALNYSEIATGISLSNYLTTASAASTYQPLDADLTAIAALGATAGFLKKTGADAWSVDTNTYSLTGHTHDAADVTSGVFDIARIPVLPSSVQIVASSNIASLTAPQQAEIGDGSIVTTTDGRRWVYTGSGSKTSEASYVELADITPEWTVIANKPSFATVATSGSYNDLSNLPSLGTMAAQNANAVAITGGTIDGVVLDGGTF